MSRANKKDTLLWHIAKILDMSEISGMDDGLMKDAKSHIDFVSNFLGISGEQAVLFSHFVGKGYDRNIAQDEIAESLKCKFIDILFYQNDFDDLIKKKLIIKRKGGNDKIRYYISLNVFDSIMSDQPVCFPEHKNLTIYDLFDVFETLVESRTDGEISEDDFCIEINSLIDNNSQLTFSKVFKSYRLDEENVGILIFFCEKFVNNSYPQ